MEREEDPEGAEAGVYNLFENAGQLSWQDLIFVLAVATQTAMGRPRGELDCAVLAFIRLPQPLQEGLIRADRALLWGETVEALGGEVTKC